MNSLNFNIPGMASSWRGIAGAENWDRENIDDHHCTSTSEPYSHIDELYMPFLKPEGKGIVLIPVHGTPLESSLTEIIEKIQTQSASRQSATTWNYRIVLLVHVCALGLLAASSMNKDFTPTERLCSAASLPLLVFSLFRNQLPSKVKNKVVIYLDKDKNTYTTIPFDQLSKSLNIEITQVVSPKRAFEGK